MASDRRQHLIDRADRMRSRIDAMIAGLNQGTTNDEVRAYLKGVVAGAGPDVLTVLLQAVKDLLPK